MNILNELNFDKAKTIGIFGNNKEEKFKTLINIYERIDKQYSSIFISFNFNKELEEYFSKKDKNKLENMHIVEKDSFYNKSISLEEQEQTLLNLFQILIKSKRTEHYFIFLDETLLHEKLISLLKITKFKNISVIYSSKTISKELLLLTDEKLYGKTLNPNGIDLIERKTGLEREIIKNMKDNEFVYKNNDSKIIIGNTF